MGRKREQSTTSQRTNADVVMLREFLVTPLPGHEGLSCRTQDARFLAQWVSPPTDLGRGTEHELSVAGVVVVVVVVEGCRLAAGETARVQVRGLLTPHLGAGRSPSMPPPALTGRLGEVALADVLQLVCMSRRAARIDVLASGAEGALRCDEGRVVHAELRDGRRGEPAFFALLAARAGTFSVWHEPLLVSANVVRDTTWLLLEAMRRRDDAARLALAAEPAVDPSADVLAAWATSDDATQSWRRPPPRHTNATSPWRHEAPEPVYVLSPLALHRRREADAQGPDLPTAARTPTSSPASCAPSAPFARFFAELSELSLRTSASSSPPSSSVSLLSHAEASHEAARMASKDDGRESHDARPAADDEVLPDEDITANLRFASLRALQPPQQGAGERDTDIVRSSS